VSHQENFICFAKPLLASAIRVISFLSRRLQPTKLLEQTLGFYSNCSALSMLPAKQVESCIEAELHSVHVCCHLLLQYLFEPVQLNQSIGYKQLLIDTVP
jgi:hypothetical protein